MSTRDEPVPLKRDFSPVYKTDSDDHAAQSEGVFGRLGNTGWDAVNQNYRSVIIAGAGAGKTFELSAQATAMQEKGRPSFFIRIEDLMGAFDDAFEVGSAQEFERWLESGEEAWIFLDSIDESRLDSPRTFEKAIKRFGNRARNGLQRAHIVLSSRPYAWRDKSDRALINRYLPYEPPEEAVEDDDEKGARQRASSDKKQKQALEVYALNPLTMPDIRVFAEHRGISDIEGLINELDRTDLSSLAARPFDLDGIFSKWTDDKILGSRLELLRHNIYMRLGEIDPDRRQRQPLNADKAAKGAQRLAAAVILTGEAGLQIPDALASGRGIDAEAVLGDWEPEDVTTLLHRGIFNDPIYGMVRFRHREVRELLAAEWLFSLLSHQTSRRMVESLIFRKAFGQTIIAPRLRPILPWLILFDEDLRQRVVSLAPEIAVEGGDAAHLPFEERDALLRQFAMRIEANTDEQSVRDNQAIIRIAQNDLSGTARELIQRYRDNDDAIFFLARLVWQGEMKDCLPLLSDIACDEHKGIYARIASVRAVMVLGSKADKDRLWDYFTSIPGGLSRKILYELIKQADTDAITVGRIFDCIDRAEDYERYNTSGLSNEVHHYIDRLTISTEAGSESPLFAFIERVHELLQRSPYVEKRDCRVSEKHIWLVRHATHAAERLIESKSEHALSDKVLTILLMEPAARFWRAGSYSDYKTDLAKTVPIWQALNDALFWQSIANARAALEAKSTEDDEPARLTNDWSVSWIGHFWNFAEARFGDVVEWVTDRELIDDRLVALSLAIRLYAQAGKPEPIKMKLQEAVTGHHELEEQLTKYLNPDPEISVERRKQREQEEQWKQEREIQEAEEARARSGWIKDLKADPERVRTPQGIEPGQVTKDQYALSREIEEADGRDKYSTGANWKALIPEFGEDVARAYRDAAIQHWRHYRPELGSKGRNLGSVPYPEIFGLIGLEIEAGQSADFPAGLSEQEIATAICYFASELNGFPSWFERLYCAYPDMVLSVVSEDLIWELETTTPDAPKHYILHDLVYYAPRLHQALSPVILEWLHAHDAPRPEMRRYLLRILLIGRANDKYIAALAQRKVTHSVRFEDSAFWYAVWVDADVAQALPVLQSWLESLTDADAVAAAQIFAVQLIGSRREGDMGERRESYRNVSDLLALYTLMHRYIRAGEDIHRANTGAYSPGPRDDAQDARDALFSMLSEMRGKDVYHAMLDLADSHPAESHRPYMRRQAQRQLEWEADLEPWTAKQVHEFSTDLIRTPITHRQLYDLSVSRLVDLKDWLERGNDSPYLTWQKATSETEMRNLITGWLNTAAHGRFTCAQENELANRQRPDIWMQSPRIEAPVPVEIKLLDKGWSGPKLCERLRNQLAGDYLREEGARCGVFLLVWQGQVPRRQWRIDGKLTALEDLQSALTRYYNSISHEYPDIDAMEIIVVDLDKRGSVSGG